MQRTLFLSFVCGLALLIGPSARAQELPPPLPGDAGNPAAIAPSDSVAPAPSGEKWRFKWHSGRWWYWLPSERWVYWHGDHWEDYLPPPPEPTVVYRPAQTYYYPSQGYYGTGYGIRYYGSDYSPSIGLYLGGGHHHHGGSGHYIHGGHYGGGHHGGGHHGGGHHGGGHHGGGHHGGHH